jgi:hypothetical protein
MKICKSGQKPESIDEFQRELERLNAEIAHARSREVGQVMDRILKMMADYSISLTDLERHRRARKKGADKVVRFRDPVTGEGWSINRRPRAEHHAGDGQDNGSRILVKPPSGSDLEDR